MMSNTALEAQLWEKVQRAYAKSRCYRAGDDPEFAKRLRSLTGKQTPSRQAISFSYCRTGAAANERPRKD